MFSTWLKENNWKGFISLDETVSEILRINGTAPFPHKEKAPRNISRYYGALDLLVSEAVKRNISIVIEDHGDFPSVYDRHNTITTPHGYESFVIGTTITKPNFEKKIQYLIDHEDLQDFREWGKIYHKRSSSKFDQLIHLFQKGLLIETEPSFISADGKPHDRLVLHFQWKEKKLMTFIPDIERYNAFYGWRHSSTKNAKIEDYFHRCDKAMTGSLSWGITTKNQFPIKSCEQKSPSAFDCFAGFMKTSAQRYSKDPLFNGYVFEACL